MDMRPDPFVPPAPLPRTVPPSRLEIIRIILRNPLELWGEPSYTLSWIRTNFFGQRTLITIVVVSVQQEPGSRRTE